MKIKFWGVRGSTPTPEQRNSRYGGNTACVEVRLTNDTLIILDCGSGLRSLGKSLAREYGARPIRGYVFLTHFHWDHIQGIPFFQPLYERGNIFAFHAVRRGEQELKGVLEGQIVSPYFPVDMSVLQSTRTFYNRDDTPINIEGAVISSAPMNHPQGCVGFRIEADGSVLAFVTDTEPGSDLHDRAVRGLAQGADVLVYDAQYTPAQLRAEKKGWGHSSWLEGTRIAKDCGVNRLILFHHDPDHDDPFIDGLVERAGAEFPRVAGAAEGMEIYLPQQEVVCEFKPSQPRQGRRYRLQIPIRVTWRSKEGPLLHTEGMSRDISRTGVYFVLPEGIRSDKPIELQIIIPNEISGQGNLAFRFLAQPVRQELVDEPIGNESMHVGVAARRLDPLSETEIEVLLK